MGNKVSNGNSRSSSSSKKLSKHVSVRTKHIGGLHTKEINLGFAQILEKNQHVYTDPTFVCDFCLQLIHLENSFNIKGCTHFYCQECTVKYVVSSLRINVTSIVCPVPDCQGVLDPDHCRQILPSDVFVSWGNALYESVFAPESDIDSTFICDFCVEPVNLKDSFNIKGCTHFYCQGCIVKLIASKLQDNVTCITCPVPDCSGELDIEYCRPIIPEDVFDRWGKALCESVVMDPRRKYLYCPYNSCSALLINEEPEDTSQSVCPHCNREFCAMCKVPWHTEFDCAMFQKLKEKGEDEMLEVLAKNKNWRRCPKCNYYVERNEGCSYILCRCRHAFCHNCGVEASVTSHTRLCPSCNE
ncbi:hypothetical protein ACFX11_027038 [Malus domestica]